MTLRKTTLLLGVGLFVSACTAENSSVFTSWNQPAGAFLDEGGFGNPTMQNTIAMKCRSKPKGYIVPDPIVVLNPDVTGDPKSPRTETVTGYRTGRIQCSGDLNGKYAKVIFDEYVKSATELPPEKQSGLAAIAATGGQ